MNALLLTLAAAVGFTATQGERVTNVVTISRTPLPGRCIECRAPNHHDRVVTQHASYELVRLEAVVDGRTNVTFVRGPETVWKTTNLALRATARTQPGAFAPVPPLPGSPSPYVITNK